MFFQNQLKIKKKGSASFILIFILMITISGATYVLLENYRSRTKQLYARQLALGFQLTYSRMLEPFRDISSMKKVIEMDPLLSTCIDGPGPCPVAATQADTYVGFTDKDGKKYYYHSAPYVTLRDASGSPVTSPIDTSVRNGTNPAVGLMGMTMYNLDGIRCDIKGSKPPNSPDCVFSTVARARAVCPGDAPTCPKALAIKFFYGIWHSSVKYNSPTMPSFSNQWPDPHKNMPSNSAYIPKARPWEKRPTAMGEYLGEHPIIFYTNALQKDVPASDVVLCHEECGGGFDTSVGNFNSASSVNGLSKGCVPPLVSAAAGTIVQFCQRTPVPIDPTLRDSWLTGLCPIDSSTGKPFLKCDSTLEL
jgi:hypothetical protein